MKRVIQIIHNVMPEFCTLLINFGMVNSVKEHAVQTLSLPHAWGRLKSLYSSLYKQFVQAVCTNFGMVNSVKEHAVQKET